MVLVFKKWDNHSEELVVNCFSYTPTKDAVYYRESKYGELKKVDSKEYCLFEVK